MGGSAYDQGFPRLRDVPSMTTRRCTDGQDVTRGHTAQPAVDSREVRPHLNERRTGDKGATSAKTLPTQSTPMLALKRKGEGEIREQANHLLHLFVRSVLEQVVDARSVR